MNEQNLDIFTANQHSVVYIQEAQVGELVALAAIRMILVGSVASWSLKKGNSVEHKEELC